jgi:hypothetical protein
MNNASQPVGANAEDQASATGPEAGAAAPMVKLTRRERAVEERSRRWRAEHQAKMAAMTEEEFEAYGREIASWW